VRKRLLRIVPSWLAIVEHVTKLVFFHVAKRILQS
jgi:hypothetical protein